MSNATKAPAKQGNKAGKTEKKAKREGAPAKFIADITKSAKDVDKATQRAETLWASACEQVSAIRALKNGALSALETGRGRDGWGSTDTTRCRFIHECLFNAAYDYETRSFLKAPIALSASEIHAFTCAAQVLCKVETPDTITTQSATQSHLSSLCSKYFDGELQQGCERGSDKASIASTGNGYAMNAPFTRAYLAQKIARGELKGKDKAPKGK